MKISLEGKVALVSGGSRGIGAAVVRKIVESGGEAIVHFGSNSEAARKLARDVGEDRVHLCQANLLDVIETENLWDQAMAWRGRVDVLINSAGVYEENSLSLRTDDWLAGWERTMRINLYATAQLCRRAVAHFKERKGGILINVSSRAGHRGDSMDHWQYGASKAGMLALVRTIARNCAKDNVLAYGIAPGFVHTEMVQRFVEKDGLEKMGALYPTGKVATADEVASAILFLASGISPQTTGNTVNFNGGTDPY